MLIAETADDVREVGNRLLADPKYRQLLAQLALPAKELAELYTLAEHGAETTLARVVAAGVATRNARAVLDLQMTLAATFGLMCAFDEDIVSLSEQEGILVTVDDRIEGFVGSVRMFYERARARTGRSCS